MEDWFGVIELDRPTDFQERFLRELSEMLDEYRPALLVPERSEIRSRGHDWTMGGAIAVRLVHREDPEATIEVAVGKDEVIVAWLTAHEHVFRADDDPARGWTSQAVDVVASILRGDLEVEDTYRGDSLVKTQVIDADRPDWVDITGTLAFWRFLRRPRRVERRRIDFGV